LGLAKTGVPAEINVMSVKATAVCFIWITSEGVNNRNHEA